VTTLSLRPAGSLVRTSWVLRLSPCISGCGGRRRSSIVVEVFDRAGIDVTETMPPIVTSSSNAHKCVAQFANVGQRRPSEIQGRSEIHLLRPLEMEGFNDRVGIAAWIGGHQWYPGNARCAGRVQCGPAEARMFGT